MFVGMMTLSIYYNRYDDIVDIFVRWNDDIVDILCSLG